MSVKISCVTVVAAVGAAARIGALIKGGQTVVEDGGVRGEHGDTAERDHTAHGPGALVVIGERSGALERRTSR